MTQHKGTKEKYNMLYLDLHQLSAQLELNPVILIKVRIKKDAHTGKW